jgi:hypothetical protein
VCGDFLQLPPVAKSGEIKKFCFEADSWSRCMQECIELREVHRQKDSEFVDLLRRVRFGVCTPEVRISPRSLPRSHCHVSSVVCRLLLTAWMR